MSDWVCMDCVADPCTTQSHAWVQAERITREDGSDAWLVGPDPEDPSADDAFDGWLKYNETPNDHTTSSVQEPPPAEGV